MAFARIIIKDEVNVQIRGVDSRTLTEIVEAMSFYVPKYMFSPKYKLGHWNGRIALAKETGKTFLHLLDRIEPILNQSGYSIIIEDDRPELINIGINPVIDENIFSAYKLKNETIVLRDYQIAAIETALANGCGVLQMATGSGKTLVAATIAQIYGEFGHVLVIVPSIDLCIQTTALFRAVGIDAGIWYGEMKEHKPIMISTWQSLDNTPELFHGIVAVIVDETHLAKARVLNDLLCGPGANVPFRFGMTGTIPPETLYQLQIKAALGPIIFELSSWELQELGVLAASEVNMIKLKDSKHPNWAIGTVNHEEWVDEVKWHAACDERIDFIAQYIREIAKTGNTLVLTHFRVMGDALAKRLNTIYYDGRVKASKRIDRYKEVDKSDNEITVSSMSTAATGIDIPRLYNVVFIEPGRSMIRTLQAIGRGLRKSDGTDGMNVKDTVTYWDIHGDDGFTKSQASERKRIYKLAKHKVEEIEVSYV